MEKISFTNITVFCARQTFAVFLVRERLSLASPSAVVSVRVWKHNVAGHLKVNAMCF